MLIPNCFLTNIVLPVLSVMVKVQNGDFFFKMSDGESVQGHDPNL